EDLCLVDLDGEQIEGERGPSSEKLLHTAIYKAFDDVQSVIHSHPVYATMFAIARRPIPACIDEFSIYVGGEVPVTEYGQSGTQDVGDNAVAVLANRGAALLANHGMVAVGPSRPKLGRSAARYGRRPISAPARSRAGAARTGGLRDSTARTAESREGVPSEVGRVRPAQRALARPIVCRASKVVPRALLSGAV